jgi:regulator of CtrA degradation
VWKPYLPFRLDSDAPARDDLRTQDFVHHVLRRISPVSYEALTMSEKSRREADLVLFSERLANSAVFSTLFREGMGLVEETAAYLDGAGRQDAKVLDRNASLTYATESMRLTTRLMQLASWLLLHRAVKEGEMSLAQANREKVKVKLTAAEPGAAEMLEKLPEKLRDLIERSMVLQVQVKRLDVTIHSPAPMSTAVGNPLVSQLDRLRAAFERQSG